MQKKIGRKAVGWGLLVLAILIPAAAVKAFYSSSGDAPQLITAPAIVRSIERTVLANGTLQALKQVSVGAQVSGQLKSLKVALDQEVKAGQLVAEIDSIPQQNALRDAQASLAHVRAQRQSKQALLQQAVLALKRQQYMMAQEASSRADLESAEATLGTTRADIAALDAQITQSLIAVDKARAELSYTRITAPMDGKVVAIVTQEGQTVNSAQAAPTIIKLAKLGTITIKAQISEADVTRVKAGQAVYFTILGEPDQRYNAVLQAIEPAPDSIAQEAAPGGGQNGQPGAAVYYNALFNAPNPDGRLRIGMTAQVYIVLAAVKDALTVPSAALDGAAGKDGLHTVRVADSARKVAPRKVRVGLNNNIDAQILEGLKAGEQVVVGEASGAPGGPGPGPGPAR